MKVARKVELRRSSLVDQSNVEIRKEQAKPAQLPATRLIETRPKNYIVSIHSFHPVF